MTLFEIAASGQRDDRGPHAELRNSLEPEIHVFDPINRSTWFDKSAQEGRSTLELHPDTPGVQNYYQLADYLIAYAAKI